MSFCWFTNIESGKQLNRQSVSLKNSVLLKEILKETCALNGASIDVLKGKEQ